jgi:hypothetical protein
MMDVYLTFACLPIGPWSTPQSVYTIPETAKDPNELAYMSTFHPEISDHGDVVTSYSLNSLDGLSALRKDDHRYQPRFIQVAAGAPAGTRARPLRAPAPPRIHSVWVHCRPSAGCS